MWNSFAAMTGGAAAGLTGLIFIVVGLRYDPVATSQEHRNRAAQALALLSTVTVASSLITMPQASAALGIELILIAVISATLLKTFDTAARRDRHARPSAELAVVQVVFVTGIALGGLLVLLGVGWALYPYAVSALVGLVGAVYGAWIFLTRAGNAPAEVSRVDQATQKA